ncbi:hypothetical protein NEHOM01_1328 [Nematocida homosporus]|uniref:uncharacterized protein n=1 Tax=Nematocida homosporus TaxID=1912981 RepID=UPI002220D315|nr:uncharacterized protein NEHOM01_1328 [Nematocida homosporus]KAI5186163.1 hypothetical protein NEHOM01_1328 [Nematocida homosporus]
MGLIRRKPFQTRSKKRPLESSNRSNSQTNSLLLADDFYWYANRLSNHKGIFFQCRIDDVMWHPQYQVEEISKEIRLQINVAPHKQLHLVFTGHSIQDSESFEFFDPELSIYTIQLVFNAT